MILQVQACRHTVKDENLFSGGKALELFPRLEAVWSAKNDLLDSGFEWLVLKAEKFIGL